MGKRRLGFADTGVVTLDPAMGTGSYLIQVIEQAATRVAKREGAAQVPARIRDIEKKLIGFEIMVGPFAVAQMLVGEEIRSRTGQIFTNSVRLYLADTLADPWLEQTRLGAIYEPIARSRREANLVKRDEPILVCIGNPPYDLHESDAKRGGWVVTGSSDRAPIWNDVVQGARNVGAAGELKPTYNLYAYFWRWA
jgi:predicted helicase